MKGATKEWQAISLDVGCNLSPSCLTCPVPVCKYEIALSTQLKIYRNNIIIRAIKESDETIREIAAKFEMSYTTVMHIWDTQEKVSPEVRARIAESEFMQALVSGASG